MSAGQFVRGARIARSLEIVKNLDYKVPMKSVIAIVSALAVLGAFTAIISAQGGTAKPPAQGTTAKPPAQGAPAPAAAPKPSPGAGPIIVFDTVKGSFEVMIPAKQTATHVFANAETVDYYCRFHPNMKGRIAVTAP